MRGKGKIIKWQEEKGFGFIRLNNELAEIFFHEKCLLNPLRKPQVGDEVSFVISTNPEGKKRAERVVYKGERDQRVRDRIFDGIYSTGACLFLLCVGYFVYLGKVDPIFLVLYLFFSIITFVLYWWDKKKAQSEGQRIPEKRLHFYSIIGGWPGALVAQRMLHHKSRKRSFLTVFYVTLALNLAGLVAYSSTGANFLLYDSIVTRIQGALRQYFPSSPHAVVRGNKAPVYSWIDEDGKKVYSNTGFPVNQQYRDGRIEWQ